VTAPACFGVDAALVVVFVLLGRRSHHEGSAIVGTLGVAAPFLVALVVGWMAGRVWQRPTSPRMGVVVWLVTVTVGMVLRHVAWRRGTAASFVVVATVVLCFFLVGWRVVTERVGARRV
jgi:Protein of unknown function (DUF3054)